MQTTTKTRNRTKNKHKTTKYRRDHRKETQSICSHFVCFGVPVRGFYMSVSRCPLSSNPSLDTAVVQRAEWRESVCVCWHRRACVGEWHCPHRQVGGGIWGGRGEYWSAFWHLCLGIISFLGKLCPVGRSGGWRGAGSAPTTPVQWNKHGGQKRHLSMLFSPGLSLGLRHAAMIREQSRPQVQRFDLSLSLYCITKSTWGLQPSLHHNAGIIFMNEWVRWSAISLHLHSASTDMPAIFEYGIS